MRILAISGSLREKSSNTILLNAASLIALDRVQFILCRELENLPHFNPDLDGENAPLRVVQFRNMVSQADGVVISSPEYAHGVPGSLKNALDWLVSSGEIVGKPCALVNASSRSHHAHEQLVEILTTMAAKVTIQTTIALPAAKNDLDETAIIEDQQLRNLLSVLIKDFVSSIETE